MPGTPKGEGVLDPMELGAGLEHVDEASLANREIDINLFWFLASLALASIRACPASLCSWTAKPQVEGGSSDSGAFPASTPTSDFIPAFIAQPSKLAVYISFYGVFRHTGAVLHHSAAFINILLFHLSLSSEFCIHFVHCTVAVPFIIRRPAGLNTQLEFRFRCDTTDLG